MLSVNILLSFVGSVLRSIFSSLYLMELVFLATFQLKLWYFVGSLPDYLGRLSHNNKETGNTFMQVSYLVNKKHLYDRVDVCPVDVCPVDVCPVDVCPVDVCPVDVCPVDVCPVDVCPVDVCPVDVFTVHPTLSVPYL